MIYQPLVSVVIPVYNAEKYIIKTLESVAQQTYKNIEIVVVDDCSTDRSEEYIVKWIRQNPQIKTVFHKNISNVGVSETRNAGVRHASGEFLAFLDADDLWVNHKLEKQIEYLLTHPQVALVHTYMLGFNEHGYRYPNRYQRKLVEQFEGNVYEKLLTGNWICTSSVVTKKNIIEEVGYFYREFTPSEDWDLWLRIARHYPLGVVRDTLVLYREVATSISKNVDAYRNAIQNVYNKHIQNIEKARQKEIYERFMSYYYYNLGNVFLGKADTTRALHYYVKFGCFKYQKWNPDYYKNLVKSLLGKPLFLFMSQFFQQIRKRRPQNLVKD